MCRHYLGEIDHLTAMIEHLDVRIAALRTRLSSNQDVDRLDTIPGLGRAAAQITIAETGGDMARSVTAGHFASWSGVCPGMNESDGVNKSGRRLDPATATSNAYSASTRCP